MKLFEGWMNHKGGRFSADITDIEAHAHGTGKDVHCPGCKKKLTMGDFTAVKDDDHDTTHWKHKCKDCGADLTIFNEGFKPTFKQFLLHETKFRIVEDSDEPAGSDKLNTFQVKFKYGGWQDVEMYFDDLEDIAARVNHPLRGPGKTDLSPLTAMIEDFIGKGPGEYGWEEMDYDVQSLSDDVLKITYTFGGVDMSGTQRKHNPDRYGEPVKRSGVVTIMPGN